MLNDIKRLFLKKNNKEDLTEREKRRVKEKDKKSFNETDIMENKLVNEFINVSDLLESDNIKLKLSTEDLPNNMYARKLVKIIRSVKKEDFNVLWNVYVPCTKKESSDEIKIDVLLVSPFKIFAFNIKEYTRCTDIIESSNGKWEVLYGPKTKFLIENPITKMEVQVNRLKEYLNISKSKIDGITLFIAGNECIEKNLGENILFLREEENNLLENKIKEIIEKEYLVSFTREEFNEYSNKLLDVMNASEYL